MLLFLRTHLLIPSGKLVADSPRALSLCTLLLHMGCAAHPPGHLHSMAYSCRAIRVVCQAQSRAQVSALASY